MLSKVLMALNSTASSFHIPDLLPHRPLSVCRFLPLKFNIHDEATIVGNCNERFEEERAGRKMVIGD